MCMYVSGGLDGRKPLPLRTAASFRNVVVVRWLSSCGVLQAQSDAVLARITTSTDKKALKDCDIVVEVGIAGWMWPRLWWLPVPPLGVVRFW